MQSLKRNSIVAIAMLTVTCFSYADEKEKAGGDKAAQDTKIIPLMNQVFDDIPGKEGLMLTVEYAPGASTPSHRHNGHVFVYVLKGSIVMQAEGGKAVTLSAGQTFYETPTDIHVVSRNASDTKPVKFVVFLVKDKGAPPVLPPN